MLTRTHGRLACISVLAISAALAVPEIAQAGTTATSTVLTLSAPIATYANETTEQFTLTVTGSGGMPTGTVTVLAGSHGTSVCTATLKAGQGSCAIPYSDWARAGTLQLTASYTGDGTFAASVSDARTLTVAKDPTTATLSFSSTRLTYGHEQSEHVDGLVAPEYSLAPQFAGPDGIMTFTGLNLVNGSTADSYGQYVSPVDEFWFNLGATALPAGVTKVGLTYSGDLDYTPSAAPAQSITVAKATSKTRLALSVSRARYGHERVVSFSVRVAPQYLGVPAGRVIIHAGRYTACVITLSSVRGSCALTATKLPTGSYRVTASYVGNADFTASASATRLLTITR